MTVNTGLNNIGFTGSREDPTQEQLKTVVEILRSLQNGEDIFNHGCCIGSDETIAMIAWTLGYTVHGHPPNRSKWIMDHDSRFLNHFEYPPAPFLVRNKRIVNCSQLLLATPNTYEQVLKSGTWSTIRYAAQQSVEYWIVTPDGILHKNFAL